MSNDLHDQTYVETLSMFSDFFDVKLMPKKH